MTLGHQYSKKLPESINVTFVDLVPKIRQLGTEYFLRQLATQREQILEYLNAANGKFGFYDVNHLVMYKGPLVLFPSKPKFFLKIDDSHYALQNKIYVL